MVMVLAAAVVVVVVVVVAVAAVVAPAWYHCFPIELCTCSCRFGIVRMKQTYIQSLRGKTSCGVVLVAIDHLGRGPRRWSETDLSFA